MAAPVPPPAGVGAPATVGVPVAAAQQVCVPGLPPGASSLALVQTKIGPVYVPLQADGTPMLSALTPQQSTAVKAALGDFFAKASMGGIWYVLVKYVLCFAKGGRQKSSIRRMHHFPISRARPPSSTPK